MKNENLDIQVHAIMQFWYANSYFYFNDLIAEALPEYDLDLTVHIDLFGLMKDLSETQRYDLIKYIMADYRGVSMDTIKRLYKTD